MNLPKPSVHDPTRLDVAALAGAGDALSGVWPGQDLRRLAETQSPPHDTGLADVAWQCAGQKHTQHVGQPELWLALGVQTEVWLTCQRCLQPLRLRLDLQQRLQFVRGQVEAEAMDEDAEHDVLALTKALDLRELVEDELLLALPLVPKHELCPQPLPVQAATGGDPEPAPRASPFAALHGFKAGPGD